MTVRNDMMVAIISNQVEEVKALVRSGCDLNVKYENGMTALHMAALPGASPEITAVLIDNGADVDAKNVVGETPLITAARNNSLKTAKVLIEKGADVNARKNNGWTALVHALRHDFTEMIKLLKKYGAEVANIDDGAEKSP